MASKGLASFQRAGLEYQPVFSSTSSLLSSQPFPDPACVLGTSEEYQLSPAPNSWRDHFQELLTSSKGLHV